MNWDIDTAREFGAFNTAGSDEKFSSDLSLEGRHFPVGVHPVVIRAYGLDAGEVTVEMVSECRNYTETLRSAQDQSLRLSASNNQIVIPITGWYRLVKSDDVSADAKFFCNPTPALNLLAAVAMGSS